MMCNTGEGKLPEKAVGQLPSLTGLRAHAEQEEHGVRRQAGNHQQQGAGSTTHSREEFSQNHTLSVFKNAPFARNKSCITRQDFLISCLLFGGNTVLPQCAHGGETGTNYREHGGGPTNTERGEPRPAGSWCPLPAARRSMRHNSPLPPAPPQPLRARRTSPEAQDPRAGHGVGQAEDAAAHDRVHEVEHGEAEGGAALRGALRGERAQREVPARRPCPPPAALTRTLPDAAGSSGAVSPSSSLSSSPSSPWPQSRCRRADRYQPRWAPRGSASMAAQRRSTEESGASPREGAWRRGRGLRGGPAHRMSKRRAMMT